MDNTSGQAVIVVGIDGSAPSLLALRWAAALAPLLKARMRAVTAWQFQIAFGTFTPVVWRPDEEARKICSQAVAQVFGAGPPEGLEQLIRQGSAAKALVEGSRRANLVVLGSRGYGGIEGLLLDAVSATVSEHARCSVLIAHGSDLPPGLSAAAAPEEPLKEAGEREQGQRHAEQ